MANKKVSQLTSKPSVLVTDLFPIADPSTGQLYKTTISDLGTAIGSGVSSVNTLVGAVVLDTDDIQELVSPTNKWFTDTRARAALSASSPLAYNSGTGLFSIPAATSSQNGYLTSTDWTTFNSKQAALSGTGFVKISGTTISYDNTSYLPLTGGTLTGTLIGTRAEFTTSTLVDGILVNNGSGRGIRIVNGGAGYGLIINNETASSAIPFVIQKSGLDKIYFTDSGAGNFTSSLTASSFVKSGGTSSQYLMADGSVSTLTNPVTGTGTSGIVAKFNGTSSVTDSIIYDNGTRVSIGADVTTSNKFTAVASTTSSYAVVAQASGAANGFWATLSGTGEIFRGQTAGGSYFIINNGGDAFLNGNLNVGDFASTSYKLKVNGTANFTGALSGTSAAFSGNVIGLQLGVGGQTPRTSSSLKTIESSNYVLEDNGDFGLKSNAYYNGTNNVYINSAGANRIYLGGGSFTYYDAPSGTAAGTVTFSPRFYIANGGNVGIGTTSPSGELHVKASSGFAELYVQGGSSTSGLYLFDQNTESGLWKVDSGYMAFGTSNAERMRITSGGSLLVGLTAVSGNVAGDIWNSGSIYVATASNGSTGQGGVGIFSTNIDIGHANGTANGTSYARFIYNGGVIGSITQSGTTAVLFNVTSDYRLKEDLKPIKGLEIVNKIKVYDYKWKSDNSRMDGVLAHELAEVLPYAVTGVKDGEHMQQVDYSKIVPVLIQAIKDQQVQIEQLKNK